MSDKETESSNDELYPYDDEHTDDRYTPSFKIKYLERRIVNLEEKFKSQIDVLDRENILLRIQITSVEKYMKDKHLEAMESINLLCIACLVAIGIVIYIM